MKLKKITSKSSKLLQEKDIISDIVACMVTTVYCFYNLVLCFGKGVSPDPNPKNLKQYSEASCDNSSRNVSLGGEELENIKNQHKADQ